MKMQIVGVVAVAMSATVLTATKTEQNLALLKENESSYRQYRAEPVIPEEEPVVLVVEQELSEFLQIAGKFNGYEVTFSGEVSGLLKDVTLPIKLPKLLPELSNSFDLKWHIQSSRLYVSTASEIKRKIIYIDSSDVEALSTAIEASDIDPDGYQITPLATPNAVLIAAPASYLDGITAILEKLKLDKHTDDQF